MTTPPKTRVAVVFGGDRAGYAISCRSADGVYGALDPAEFDVVAIGVTDGGRWVLTDGDPGALAPAPADPDSTNPDVAGSDVADPAARQLPATRSATPQSSAPDPLSGHAVIPGSVPRGPVVLDATEGARALGGIDVVFPVLPGTPGEAGAIQGLLEMAGIRYVGSDVFASAASADREFTRKLAAAEGVPVGGYVVLRTGQTLTDDDQKRLGLPVLVAPARGGSAGTTRVTDWAALDDALAAARAVDPKVLVEAQIVGRAVACGVLGDGPGGDPLASQPAEAHPGDDPGSDGYDIPARLPERVTEAVRRHACTAFTALGCAGMARVDFLVTPELDVYLAGIVTTPELTPESPFARMWVASGVDYPTLIARLVRSARQS